MPTMYSVWWSYLLVVTAAAVVVFDVDGLLNLLNYSNKITGQMAFCSPGLIWSGLVCVSSLLNG